MLKRLLILTLVSGGLLTACMGNSATSNGSNTPIVQSQAGVVIDPMSNVPVLNGTGTKGTLYIHNYTNQDVSGLNFNLNQATFNSQIKALIAKAGLNLGGGIEDKNGFVLLNSERCIKIAANSSCAINFTTPNLSFGNQGSALVNVNYKLNGKSVTNSQVVNYNYVDSNLSTGVNFTGNVDLSGIPGTTKYVVGYLYGGNANGGVYKNVNLVSNNPTATISGGFINSQEVASNQVIAVEYRIAIQSDQKSFINIVPTWGNSVSNVSRSNINVGSGTILGIIIDPQQSAANYLFGNVPILRAAPGESATIAVVNNGNANGGAITVAKSGNNPDDISINTSDCTAGKLQANAVGSCNIVYTVNTYSPGSVVVDYEVGGNIVGSQIVYWNNDKPVPAVYSVPTIKNIAVERESETEDIQFDFGNTGKAPLESMIITPVVTGPAQWIVTENTCTSLTTMSVNGSCRITGHIKSNANNGIGTVYYMIKGNYSELDYSFSSIPLRYMVLAIPEITITPAEKVDVVIMANGESATSNTYMAKNIGNDPALFNSVSLSAMTTAVNPVISGGTCSANTVLNLNESCSIVVTYGPEPLSVTTSESGSTHVVVSYHGGTPDINRETVSESYNYTLMANDTYVVESISITGFESGIGTVSEPYVAKAFNESGEIKVTYTNQSMNYPLESFNLNTNNLPYGMKVISNSCVTGSNVMTLAIGASCEIKFGLDRELLKDSAQGGSTVFDFTLPTATWVSPFGFYTEPGSDVYVSYLQPTVNFSLSLNNGDFESTVLTASLVNASSGVSPFVVNISGIKDWVESSPVALSNNCTVNAADFSASCSLSSGANESGYIAYIMPQYILENESSTIPLFYSTTSFGNLSPTYNFINYIVPLPVTFTQLSTNSNFSCALGDNGKTYCWGYGGDGQIGNGAWNSVNKPTAVTMPSGVAFTSISTNIGSSCAFGDNGKAYCWGAGAYGQIGNGADSNVNIPKEVKIPNGVAFTSISATDGFSCALSDESKAYCWGSGIDGRIGNGANNNVNKPTAVTMPSGVAFTSISINNWFSCALGDNDSAYCWGTGYSGRIGNGAYLSVNIPTEVTMPSGVTFTSISTNSNFSCALGNNGNAYCWGKGNLGQIGNGGNGYPNIPTAVTMPSGVAFTSISTNDNFSCALDDNGKAYCWGAGTSGQIGNGASESVNIPKAVTMPSGVAFTSISTNVNFSCALDDNAKAYCWGTGTSGQIGNGANSNVNIPTAVTMPSGVAFTSISTNDNFSCALGNNDKTYCWGYGANGRIGNGANSNVNVPTKVTMPLP